MNNLNFKQVSDIGLNEISVFPFTLADDCREYYCSSYSIGSIEGMVIFHEVYYLSFMSRTSPGYKYYGSIEVPVSRVKEVKIPKVQIKVATVL
ncbi:MAG: hypothetical protein KBF75_04190 [Saprospiraceae bacterium]|nr:hypothetical protein [Saprospiraceae bacterium]